MWCGSGLGLGRQEPKDPSGAAEHGQPSRGALAEIVGSWPLVAGPRVGDVDPSRRLMGVRMGRIGVVTLRGSRYMLQAPDGAAS